MISGFIEPTEGAVRIGGKDMARHRPQQAPDRADLPEPGAVPADAGLGEHRLRAEVRGVGQGRPPRRAEELLELVACPSRRTSASPSFPAARSSASPSPGRSRSSPQVHAARRTAVRARSQAAPAHARRAARHPEAHRRHLHLHHPRPGRGADHVRPGRGDVARRASSRSATAGRSTTTRPTPSSPPSSARTTASPAGSSRRPTAEPRSRPPAGSCIGRDPRDLRERRPGQLFVRPERMRLADGADDDSSSTAERRTRSTSKATSSMSS